MTAPTFLDHPAFAWACRAIAAAAAVYGLWALVSSPWSETIVSAVIALIATAALYGRARLPILFGLSVAVAAAVNGAGYVFTLWHEETAFDEIVHAYTGFAGMAAIGWAMFHGRLLAGWPSAWLVAAMLGIGLLLGIAWEGFEALIGIIGSRRDTLIDLAMDMAGALIAAALICWVRSRSRQG